MCILLRFYLEKYYDQRNDTTNEITDCADRDLDQLRQEFYTKRAQCAFDYKEMLRGTTCDPADDFGYTSSGTPCVLLKLNRIYSWTPQAYTISSDLPDEVTRLNVTSSVLDENIIVDCEGEHSSDRDALSDAQITYYSVNSRELNIYHVGLLPFYYFPYLNQANYKAPLIFAQFQNVPDNQLINIICRAYARNIDSSDKLNLRGMAFFQLLITKWRLIDLRFYGFFFLLLFGEGHFNFFAFLI